MPDRPLRQDFRRTVSLPVRFGRPGAGSRRGGFSLIELVVTISIVAILTGFALPSLGRLLGGSRLTATVNELVFSLQSARSEAIKRAAHVALCASASPLAADATCDGTSYADGWIVYVDGTPGAPGMPDTPPNGLHDAGEELIVQAEPPGPALTFAPDATVATQVRFVDSGASATAGGTPISGGIRIEHAAEERAVVVRVGANGRVASEKVP